MSDIDSMPSLDCHPASETRLIGNKQISMTGIHLGTWRGGGFSLVELMVALTLGLIVIGSVISIFLSNQQTSRTNQALGEVQDNARTAFEFMARDIRTAGLTGCGNSGRVANVLNDGPTAVAANGGTVDWWANWNNAIYGYDGGATDPAVASGTGSTQRVSTTSSLELLGAEGNSYTISANSSGTTPPTFTLNENTSNIQAGDILIVCDPDHATLFQATAYNSGSPLTITYKTGTSSPGNCSTGLGWPSSCSGNTYTFGENAKIAKLAAVDWYVGNNSVGGTSLYRYGLSTTKGVVQATTQEIVRNVTDMQIKYLLPGSPTFTNAAGVNNNWSQVTAIQITFKLQSTNQFASTTAQPLTSTITSTITLRNRVN